MGQGSQQNSGNASSGVGISNGVNSGVNGSFNTGQNGTFGQTNSGNSGFNTSTGTSSGGSASQSSSAGNVWGAQSPFLKDGYKGAQGAFDAAMAGIDGMTPQMAEQVQGVFDQGMGAMGNASQGGFSAGLQGQVGPNAYTDALKGDIVSDAGKLKQQTLGSLDARAAAAGMSGSSGYRDQVADSFGEIDSNAQQQMNQLGFNAHNQGVQNQMGLASQMDAAQMNALGQTGALQGAAMNQAQPYMLGQQAAANYMGAIGGPTVLNSSQSSSSSSNSSNNNGFGMSNGFSNGMNMGFGNTMGGSFGSNGGMNQGTNVNNSTGNSSGTSLGVDGQGAAALSTAWSDANLKENIRLVDHIDGINMYEWDWKDESISSPMNYGVIAQEVAITHPQAVSVAGNGYLVVDYTQLGGAGRAAMSRMEASA